MKAMKALASGLAGTAALTGLHQFYKKISKEAPRIDELGMQAISKIPGVHARNKSSRKALYYLSLSGDFLFNSFYYSLIAAGRKPLLNGSILGFASGVGTLSVPQLIGLDPQKTTRSFATRMMAISIYLTGGLVAGLVYRIINS